MTKFEKQLEASLTKFHEILRRVPSRERTPVHWMHVGIVDKFDYLIEATLSHIEKEAICLEMGDGISAYQRSQRQAELSAYKFHAGLLACAMIDVIEMMDESWCIPTDKTFVVKGDENAEETE